MQIQLSILAVQNAGHMESRSERITTKTHILIIICTFYEITNMSTDINNISNQAAITVICFFLLLLYVS